MANSTEGMNWKAGITSYQLKWIAIVTMVIDHMGAILYPTEMVFRYIGRISFPIFCFLLVEGFCHTHDIFGYMARLGAFALMSEIPYDLAFNGEVLEFTHQNVFFTLLLGVILMYVLEKGGEWPQKAVEVLLVMWMAVFFSYRLWLQGNPADIYILPAAALPVGKAWMRSGLESDLESEHTGIWRICHDSDRII